jgi:hypothetical protein
MTSKRGLQLDRVVLLGRTFDEYSQFFAFAPEDLANLRVLDLASGVSSFCAEANARGFATMAADPIYDWTLETIAARCQADLESVCQAIGGLPTYRWTAYRNPGHMKSLREQACQTFLRDYELHQGTRYVSCALPELPFSERAFDLTFVSYFLFVYQDRFGYEFHRDSILEIMRVTTREARIYPLVTFEARRSDYLDALARDPALAHLRFEEVRTDF